MTVEEYFSQSVGDFPKPNISGVSGPWMPLGSMNVPYGKLWAGDPWIVTEEDGVVVNVKPGLCHVEIQGMDFEGHRRIARVRVYCDEVTDLQIKPMNKTVCIDVGELGVSDMVAISQAIEPDHYEDYMEDLNAASSGGLEYVAFDYEGKSFEMILIPGGLGDGEYDVFELVSNGKTVGLEIEFLPADFVLDTEVQTRDNES
ncbi:MAG: hypothetical protein CMJ19_11695 [Phycisphaeraceae bacterium]|nr:hypothetical protein [Phycisphaeraceae bacterium]